MAKILRHGVDVSAGYTPTEYAAIRVDERAHDGETGQGTAPVPDLPGTTVAYSGQRFEIIGADSSVVFDGFIGGRTRDRGESATGTRLLNTHPVVDQNALLTGFRSGLVNRPSETDYDRMTWFFSTYLPALDRTWVLNSNTALTPAKTYNTESLWQELLADLLDLTGKTGFVEAGRAHWHLPSQGIASGVAISDLSADVAGGAWRLYSPTFTSDPMELRNDIRVEDSAGNSGTATDATSITAHDADGVRHQTLIQTSSTATSLAAQAAAYLAAHKDELLTYECDVGPLTAAQVEAVPAGSLVTMTSFVMGLSASTQRIVERLITIKHPDHFYLHLFLSFPIRRNLRGARTINPLTNPVTTVFDIHASPPHVTAYKVGDSTKSAYLYITAGAATDPILTDEFDLAGPRPSVNISFTSDQTGGDGVGVFAGSTVFATPYPLLGGPVGMQYPFKLGVPVTFFLWAKYSGAAGGTMYSDGATFFALNINGTSTPFPGLQVIQSPVAPSSTGPGGTICLGSVILTYYPGGFTDPAVTKGDLIGMNAAGVAVRIPATGTAGDVLTEDPTQASGWKSAPPKSARTFPFFGG